MSLTEDERARVRAMTASIARKPPLRERIKAELAKGPATRAELQAVLMDDMGENRRQVIKSELRRLRIAGDVHEIPMQTWSGRRVQVSEVMVWALVEHGSAAA